MIHGRVCGVVLTAEIGAAKHSRSQEKALEVKGVDHRKSWCLQWLSGSKGFPIVFKFSASTASEDAMAVMFVVSRASLSRQEL